MKRGAVSRTNLPVARGHGKLVEAMGDSAWGDRITGQEVGDREEAGKYCPLSRLGITSSLNLINGYLEFTDPTSLQAVQRFYVAFDGNHFIGFDSLASFLNARFADNNGDISPAMVSDLAIALDGSVLLSVPAPLPVTAPEPTTLVLLGNGVIGFAVLRRRRRTTF